MNVQELKSLLAHNKEPIALAASLILWLLGDINPSLGSTLPGCVRLRDTETDLS